jgi:FMN phosphatase YigB (HAD superfamily)
VSIVDGGQRRNWTVQPAEASSVLFECRHVLVAWLNGAFQVATPVHPTFLSRPQALRRVVGQRSATPIVQRVCLQERHPMHYLFDWGDTLMADIPGNTGPMCNWPSIQVMPNAKETLRHLSQRVKCHIATNAEDSESSQIRLALARGGLEPFITDVFCYKTVGQAKPSPEFFAHVSRKLQVNLRDLVMVGDDLEKDIIGAMNCGLQAIWYNPNGCIGPSAIFQIGNLIELTEIVEQNIMCKGK